MQWYSTTPKSIIHLALSLPRYGCHLCLVELGLHEVQSSPGKHLRHRTKQSWRTPESGSREIASATLACSLIQIIGVFILRNFRSYFGYRCWVRIGRHGFEVQQRGISATSGIIKHLLEGVSSNAQQPALVCDLLPNRLSSNVHARIQCELDFAHVPVLMKNKILYPSWTLSPAQVQ